MQDNDQIGIARFDHEADVLLPMTLKTPGIGTTLTGTGLDPRGATSIGGGILVGSGLINGPGATRTNKAMLVLTDGNENTDPLISALPPGTINQTTFAIGFGLPGQVSPDPQSDLREHRRIPVGCEEKGMLSATQTHLAKEPSNDTASTTHDRGHAGEELLTEYSRLLRATGLAVRTPFQ
jgi:hypothetical protein